MKTKLFYTSRVLEKTLFVITRSDFCDEVIYNSLIFSDTTFDATNVDPLTVTLASAPVKLKGQGTPMASYQDVNNDGLMDLVVHVSTQALQLTNTDTEALVEGQTFDGIAITGSDSVRIVQ